MYGDRVEKKKTRKARECFNLQKMYTDGHSLPRMSTFGSKAHWRPFYAQLSHVHVANGYKWGDEKKLNSLVRCLLDEALKFYGTRPEYGHILFLTLVQNMNERFGDKDLPNICYKTYITAVTRASKSSQKWLLMDIQTPLMNVYRLWEGARGDLRSFLLTLFC
jgi:hypothetical protein